MMMRPGVMKKTDPAREFLKALERDAVSPYKTVTHTRKSERTSPVIQRRERLNHYPVV